MRVVFENATIADSITKAARVAPTKGEAFDKASGILMTLSPEDHTVTLQSTNLHVFYLEVVDAVEVDIGSALDTRWRFNAQLLQQVCSKLPIGSGKTVSLETKDGNEVLLKSGRTTARFRTMDVSYYPEWEPFDPDKLEMVPDFGARVKQVEWASSDDIESQFTGIHLDGEYAMATDRFRIAVVPCEAEPIFRPVTIPSGILKPVLTNMRDVAIGIDEGMFLLMPDTTTQIRTRIYDREYPPIMQKINTLRWDASFKVRKSALLEIMERAAIFAQRDRSPKMTFIIGKSEIAVMCSDADLGLLGDAIELPDGQASHNRVRIVFTPKNLQDAIQFAPSDEIEIHYNPDDASKPFKIDGGSGYVAVVMPRKPLAGEEGA